MVPGFGHLSQRVRHDFFRRLSERQIEARDLTERGPPTRLHEDRSTPVATRAASYMSGASEDPAKPASASCSGSGRSRKDSIPKAAKKASVVTKV